MPYIDKVIPNKNFYKLSKKKYKRLKPTLCRCLIIAKKYPDLASWLKSAELRIPQRHIYKDRIRWMYEMMSEAVFMDVVGFICAVLPQ